MLKNRIIKLADRVAEPLIRVNPFGRARLKMAKARLKMTNALSSQEIIRLFGRYRFRIDLSMGCLQRELFLGAENYETDTQLALRRLLKPGATAFDIGAQVGFFTVLLADLVGPGGLVFSFEPYPPNRRMLHSNINSNRLHWVTCLPFACSDKEGTAVLSINPINDGGHSLGDFKDNPDIAGRPADTLVKVPVKTTTLDTVARMHRIRRIDLLKVDVEGAETLVFAGASHILSRADAPVLICEVGDKAQRQFGKTEKDLRRLLYGYGYRSYFITDGRFTKFDITTPVRGLPNILFTKSGVE
jgi:FkbM family methyltransferase